MNALAAVPLLIPAAVPIQAPLTAPVQAPLLENLPLMAAPEPPEAEPLPASGAALREFIWTRRIVPSAYPTLPVEYSGLKNAVRIARALLTSGRTFDHDGDELPPGHALKALHPFGSVLKVRYVGRQGHPFTGLFAEKEVPGLVRFSLAKPPTSPDFIPGTALKLFIDGRPSANALFLGRKTGVDGQQPDRNFFAQAFTNILPKPVSLANKVAALVLGLFNRGNALSLPVSHFAAHGADGAPVPRPVSPYQLFLQPVVGAAAATRTTGDFRVGLSQLPLGRVFQVYAADATDGHLYHVGDLEAESKPVASEYGDRGLFFRHPRGLPAPSRP